jgi:CheY-like chemotaxis protein
MADPRLIVVVDDDTDLRETIRELLVQEGFVPRCFEHGRAALEWLRCSEGAAARLILLDLMMPEMNGWQFREAQLAEPRLAGIPVLVMTASRSLAEHPIDASEIILKPVALEELILAVERNAL